MFLHHFVQTLCIVVKNNLEKSWSEASGNSIHFRESRRATTGL